MPARHDLIWPAPAGWVSVQESASGQPTSVRDAVARWRAADWPLVVRRADPDQAAGEVAVGLPLPPDVDGNKVRLGARIARDAVATLERPVTLERVLSQVPPQWRAAFLALHLDWPPDLAPLRCYGSLAWQTITGMPYLRPGSDIDLLFEPASREQLTLGTAALQRHAGALPLDGEIVFPGEVAVAWREWQAASLTGGAGTVLAKRRDRVQLISCQALLLLFSLPVRAAECDPPMGRGTACQR